MPRSRDVARPPFSPRATLSAHLQPFFIHTIDAFPLIAKLSFWLRPESYDPKIAHHLNLKKPVVPRCTRRARPLASPCCEDYCTTVYRIDQISFRTFPCVSVCIRSAVPFQHFPFYLSPYHRTLPHSLSLTPSSRLTRSILVSYSRI